MTNSDVAHTPGFAPSPITSRSNFTISGSADPATAYFEISCYHLRVPRTLAHFVTKHSLSSGRGLRCRRQSLGCVRDTSTCPMNSDCSCCYSGIVAMFACDAVHSASAHHGRRREPLHGALGDLLATPSASGHEGRGLEQGYWNMLSMWWIRRSIAGRVHRDDGHLCRTYQRRNPRLRIPLSCWGSGGQALAVMLKKGSQTNPTGQ
jgi:hypothetical protein